MDLVHRRVYASIGSFETNDDSFATALEAWRRWCDEKAARRADLFSDQTGESHKPEPIDSESGRYVPIDGIAVEIDTWVSPTDPISRLAELVTREFQGESRFWKTEVTLAATSRGACSVAVKMGPETQPNIVRPHAVSLSAPGVWRSLSRAGSLKSLGGHCHHGETLDNGSIINAITADQRRLPLVVVSVENSTGRFPLSDSLPEELAEQLFGIAEVGCLRDSDSAWAFSDAVGSDHSCYNGAVRVYWPGFSRTSRPDFRWLFLPRQMDQLDPRSKSRAFSALLLRRLSMIAAGQYAPPNAVSQLMDLRQKTIQSASISRIRSAIKDEQSDAAQSMIEEEIERLQQSHQQELDGLREQHKAQLHAAYASVEQADDAFDPEDEDRSDRSLLLEYFCSGNKRRPVLDFADTELAKAPETRRAYLSALTKMSQRWQDGAGHYFDKVTGATVKNKSGVAFDLWEYRAVKQQGKWVRVFFAIIDRDTALLLHAIEKRQNSLSAADYEPAKQRLAEYL